MNFWGKTDAVLKEIAIIRFLFTRLLDSLFFNLVLKRDGTYCSLCSRIAPSISRQRLFVFKISTLCLLDFSSHLSPIFLKN